MRTTRPKPAPEPAATPPAPAAPAATGTIELRIKAVWANISVDGIPVAQRVRTKTLSLPARSYHVHADNPDHGSFDGVIELKPGDNGVKLIELQSAP